MKLTLRRNRAHWRNKNAAIITKYAHSQLTKVWRESVRAFIREVSKHVAIDTGMSMATLMPLAAKVQLASFIRGKLTGAAGRSRKRYSSTAFPGVGDYKSAAHGRKLAESRRNYTLEFGTPTNPRFRFAFDVVVLQYYLHEYGIANSNGQNWQSLEKGRIEFLKTWHRLQPRYLAARDINRWLLNGELHSAR